MWVPAFGHSFNQQDESPVWPAALEVLEVRETAKPTHRRSGVAFLSRGGDVQWPFPSIYQQSSVACFTPAVDV